VLLDRVMARNPQLIEAAVELHQSGIVPPGTYIIDLDAVAVNARAMADEAHRHGLRVLLMTKQNGRNPFASAIALEQGIDATVVVEAREAHVVHRYGLPIGHVGHLSNVPKNEVPAVVAMQPGAITVFTPEAAQRVSDAAAKIGRVQDLYMRVSKPGDEIFRGMVGGWTEDSCVGAAKEIMGLHGVRLAGLTAFPTTSYQTEDPRKAVPNDTFFTMMRAKMLLESSLGLSELTVNAPSGNSCATFGMLAAHGATEVEPGTALMGSSKLHARYDLREKPAQVYVSEIMHHWEGEAYVLGGGMTYMETYGGEIQPADGLVASSVDDIDYEKRIPVIERGVIDYHVVCGNGSVARVGDTAVFALHPQYFVNRAYVAAVSGVSEGKPRLEGIFDSATSALDDRLEPLVTSEVVGRIRSAVTGRYRRDVTS
jgi:predicted amino acid racemase